jgi:hypothetical protein
MFEKSIGAPQDERFWIAAMAVLTLGAQMANSLNLTRFDVGHMVDFMVATVAKLRVIRGASDLEISKVTNMLTMVSLYINDSRRSIVETKTMLAPPGRRMGGAAPIQATNLHELQYSQRLSIHIATDDQVIRISKTNFADWLGKKGLPAGTMIPALMKAYGISEVRNRIGVGTNLKTTYERLLELDCTRPDLAILLTN